MKKISILFALCSMLYIGNAHAYQLVSNKELGAGEAKTQNVTVQCTTATGKISTESCRLRRQVSCKTVNKKQVCSGWQPWRDLRNPGTGFGDWRNAADACCRAKGLR
ncbi:MAG: hypothetical protein FWG39_03345 [Alphaproteobacteria bacterium]|nr:hypothetical protein [Alphaproteobacteria bacterium]